MTKGQNRLKIAIFHCGFVYSGGGERIVLEEARGLKQKGYEVSVYAPTIDNKLCYPKLLQELKVKTFLPSYFRRLPLRDALRMSATSLLAPFLAYRFKNIDIFIGANQPGAWIAFCMAKVLAKPYLVYMNQPNRLIYPRGIDKTTGWQNRKDYYLLAAVIKLLKPLVAWFDRISFTSGQAVLVNGSYIGQTIEKIYKQKTILCPAGAYPQLKNKLKLKKSDIYQGTISITGGGHKFAVKKPYIIITNRHEPQKRFDYVLQAFKIVYKKHPNLRLVVPGSFTAHTKELIGIAHNLHIAHRVIFPGQISEGDLQRLYSLALVHCYPSPDEDFGLGPLEAGAWAVPTVAWNHGGPTVTVVNGKTGYLAKPYQIKDYAKGIAGYINSPNQRIEHGKNAHKHLSSNFSWKKHIEIIEKEINKAKQ